MSGFRYRWRWTDADQTPLASKDLARLRPFAEEKAKQLWETSRRLASDGCEFLPNESLFEPPVILEAPHENQNTSTWLEEQLPQADCVLVSWQPDTALETDRDLFIRYWDSFCYEASDDTSIWPPDESWVLHFWHEDRFYFSRRLT